MNWVDKLTARTWSILVIGMLAFAFSGCEGDTGPAGATGATGAEGPEGPPGPVPDDVQAAIDAANPESCGTCHDGVGDIHQAEYNKYNDPSDLALTVNDVLSADNGDGTFTVTVDIDIAKNGLPLADVGTLDQLRFIAVRYDSATSEYFQGGQYFRTFTPTATAGNFTGVNAVVPFDPTVDGMVYGYIADEEFTPGDVVPGKHINLYDNVANAALAFGAAVEGAAGSYVSVANSSACTNCHGTPYMKHGFRAGKVETIPDFAGCKSCHYDDRSGGHEDWQYMVDDPFGWATDVAPTGDYAYTANVMNDTHMSHAMEFPYPQSMANCITCHEGNIATILDDANFTPETCKSCHPVEGINAWPEDAGTTLEGEYADSHRAPPLEYLWTQRNVESFHNIGANCQSCHGTDGFSSFADLHSGYDATIYDDQGNAYADTNTVAITDVTRNGDLMTVNFTATNPDISPTLAISYYGWDSKHYIVAAHERDSNDVDCPHSSRPGCNIEWSPGSTKPFFTEEAGSVAGNWSVTFDMAGYQAPNTNLIPQLILDGVVNYAEVSVLPRLEIGTTDVVLEAVSTSYDLGTLEIVDEYFQGDAAVVDISKCNACHDTLGSTFHAGRGRGGDSMQVCKACHATTFAGSHIEMASRSIDNYVHSIHSFQDFDPGDTFETFDPVLAKRYDQHINHTFPNFTILNCEACHNAGTYNVPNQAQSMPGVQSAADTLATWYDRNDPSVEDPAGRNIGSVPEYVVGPASRSCGGCHRADMINADDAGELASFNAHTQAFGTLVENDDDDLVLYGIIDKIMGMFE